MTVEVKMTSRRKLPDPLIIGGIACIRISQGEWAVVDLADLHLVQHTFWSVWRRGRLSYAYAMRKNADGSRTGVQMHRVIMGLTDPKILCDHRDLDGLNCRRGNLRIATYSQNQANKKIRKDSKTGMKGVSLHAPGKWRAVIRHQGKTHHIGLFDSKEAAHAAYAERTFNLNGEFARAL